MGNSCCASKDLSHIQINTFTVTTHQISNLSDNKLNLPSFENYVSSEEIESPIQTCKQLTPSSKMELDFTQTTLNSRKKKRTTINQIDKPQRQSIRISNDNFVTMKQRNVDDYYQLIKKLGSGSYGNVYKVRHKQTGLIRAMKQIKKQCLILEDQERMLSEINVLKALDHPNIVKVYECYQNDMSYYIITEYLSGGELFSQIKAWNVFNEQIAANLMRSIIRAVAYCHEKKIVHRDIKPENILFTGSTVDTEVKIIDFGTSRYFKSDQMMKKKLGTPYYIAPEVLSQNYDEKVDIWSCGVILYIFLCGYPPFSGQTDQITLELVRLGRLTFDQKDWKYLSDDSKDLIKHMLNINPKLRYNGKQVLEHPWIQRNTYPNLINPYALQNLQKFSAQSYFKKAMLSFIVNQTLPSIEIKELHNSFSGLDTNQDGFLSRAELILGYQEIIPDKEMAEQNVNKILEYVDINFSGMVDYSEFIMAAINVEKLVSVERVKEAYKMLDLNHDGYLSKEELEEAMGSLGDDVWQQYLLDCDYNKDGKISESEFTQLLLSKF